MTKPTQWPCRGCGALLSGKGGKRYCGPDCRPRCSVGGCEKPEHSKGWCSAHATRAHRYGDPQAPLLRQPNHGECSVADCHEPMRKRGWCANHYGMWRRFGEVREWSYRWGEGGYASTHTWLRRRLGKPSDLRCVDCGGSAEEWSYDGGDPDELQDAEGRVYTRNPLAYSPRCVRCHRIFDNNPIAVRSP